MYPFDVNVVGGIHFGTMGGSHFGGRRLNRLSLPLIRVVGSPASVTNQGMSYVVISQITFT